MQGVAEWGQPPWIGFSGRPTLLEATRHADVLPLLREVERATGRGRWAAGFVSYEAAPAFDPALAAHPPGALPLAWFALFDSWEPAAPPGPAEPAAPELAPALPAPGYAERIARIKDCIARGETYQVNFTFPLRGVDPAPPFGRFAALFAAQRSRYSAFIETDNFSAASVSPELFFSRAGDRLTCRPMKGTAARGRWTEEDADAAERLRASTKDRAENVMIVDMMRNDLGRIARPGTVVTRRLFDVERLPTVWQMTSTVEAESGAGLPEIFQALFPCASVTGAPKVRTMRIIRELEPEPRGLYTGAVGQAGPDRRAQFNVAIRTLVRQAASGETRYGIGSGVVWDSDPDREYEECLAKARVLAPIPAFRLFTTLRWTREAGARLWERHVERLARSAEYHDFPFERAAAEEALRAAAAAFPGGARRVRILLAPDGGIAVEHSPLDAMPPAPRRIAPASAPVAAGDRFLFHKTTRRGVYEAARAARPDAEDVLLWNDAGEITETTIANVAVLRAGRWTTPPIRCGLLPGVMREELLADGSWIEGPVRRDELPAGSELQLANALRGVWGARLVE